MPTSGLLYPSIVAMGEKPIGMVFPVGLAAAEDFKIPDSVWEFLFLLDEKKLPRFSMFRQGVGNCHSLVSVLYLDLKDAGVADRFKYTRGSCSVIAGPDDPDGLHSWIEIDGWAIDGSGGAVGNPILVQEAEIFRKDRGAANIHDIPIGPEEAA